MSEYILKVNNVKKNFGGVHALKGVSLEIKKGEIHCLAGENGCGKSTLIKVISGFHAADSGSFEIDGTEYKKISLANAIASGIQVIYQDFSVFPNLTVLENLAINRELMTKSPFIDWKRMKKTAMEATDRIGYKIDFDELVGNVSVADKQLIAISRALLYNAKLIIMDEPTTALTKKEVKALFNIIKKLQAQGIAILFVSHKLDEVFEISERFTILRNGENIISGNTSDLDDKKFTEYMTGRSFEKPQQKLLTDDKEDVLQVQNLCLKNGFQNISFSLKKGEILGITGLLGSGRTELVQSLFGYIPYDSGNVYVNGEKVVIKSVRDAIKNKIGYVPEDRLTEGLFLTQTIEKNIAVSKLNEYTNKAGFLDSKKMSEDISKWIELLAIVTKNAEQAVQTLSGGNQQKVVLARWLAINLDILILNGPTVGVDIGTKYDIHDLIRKLAEKGVGIIIISDDIPEIMDTCHRILIMRSGKITDALLTAKTDQKQLVDLTTHN